jgi:hypothetical protein
MNESGILHGPRLRHAAIITVIGYVMGLGVVVGQNSIRRLRERRMDRPATADPSSSQAEGAMRGREDDRDTGGALPRWKVVGLKRDWASRSRRACFALRVAPFIGAPRACEGGDGCRWPKLDP